MGFLTYMKESNMSESPNKKTKLALSLDWLDDHPNIFQCIHCHAALKRVGSSLVCDNRHQFDGTKKGYFYLSKQATQQTDYDKILFEHRRYIISQSSFYTPLIQTLTNLLNKYLCPNSVVLDAGSGEGSYLHLLNHALGLPATLIGVDLAKEGVQLATSYNGELLSLVADLANLPIQDKKVDVILSILSPANYSEFKRVLKEEGLVIKIIPESNYLIQIRQALVQLGFDIQEKHDNQAVVEKFQEAFPDFQSQLIDEKIALSHDALNHLLLMTPLTWHLKQEERENLIAILPKQIHLHLVILIGHKKTAK